jgi:hypothetical protein
LKPVADKQGYIAALRMVIREMHHCRAVYYKTIHVNETLEGKTVWAGEVEVFNLIDHPKAKRCFAWAHLEDEKDEKTRYVAVLELPPVDSALRAVQASIMADVKKGQ